MRRRATASTDTPPRVSRIDMAPLRTTSTAYFTPARAQHALVSGRWASGRQSSAPWLLQQPALKEQADTLHVSWNLNSVCAVAAAVVDLADAWWRSHAAVRTSKK